MPAYIARRTVLQKVRGQPYGLPQLVGTGFQVLFHSPPGDLFTFPSQYCFSIGHWVVFSLTEWSPLFHTAFLVFRATLDTVCFGQLSHTGVSPSLPGLSSAFLLASLLRLTVRTPLCKHNGLGSSAFDRLYLRNRFSFSSSAYLDVSVQRVPFRTLWIHVRMTGSLLPGFPIQTSADHSLCAAPRSFSQLITSFVGSQCQGIRPAPL